MTRTIPSSELILNPDGSIFHLHLHPDEVADTVILVGDPGRVERVAAHFDRIEHRVANREFITVTGWFRNHRMSVLSTGIGIGNIDIVVNELDALCNIDFTTRTPREPLRSLRLVRLGTCGAIQPELQIGELILSRYSVGFDGLLNYYAGRNAVCDLLMEQAFIAHTQWRRAQTSPYIVACSDSLAHLFADIAREGITISAPGFYGPQGRALRIQPADTELNAKIESFRYGSLCCTNMEMEGSALSGLSRLLGHEAITLCTVIAQRIAGKANPDYQPFVEQMICRALEKLSR